MFRKLLEINNKTFFTFIIIWGCFPILIYCYVCLDRNGVAALGRTVEFSFDVKVLNRLDITDKFQIYYTDGDKKYFNEITSIFKSFKVSDIYSLFFVFLLKINSYINFD